MKNKFLLNLGAGLVRIIPAARPAINIVKMISTVIKHKDPNNPVKLAYSPTKEIVQFVAIVGVIVYAFVTKVITLDRVIEIIKNL